MIELRPPRAGTELATWGDMGNVPARFLLVRDEDVNGVSGIGAVAEGVAFGDGTCAMRWRGGLASTAVYQSIRDLIAIHGHEGRTRVEWIDGAL